MRPRRIAMVRSMGPFRRFMGEALIFALARPFSLRGNPPRRR